MATYLTTDGGTVCCVNSCTGWIARHLPGFSRIPRWLAGRNPLTLRRWGPCSHRDSPAMTIHTEHLDRAPPFLSSSVLCLTSWRRDESVTTPCSWTVKTLNLNTNTIDASKLHEKSGRDPQEPLQFTGTNVQTRHESFGRLDWGDNWGRSSWTWR